MVSELTVAINDEEKNLRTKYLIYETYTTDENDPVIKDCIEKTLDNFNGEPTDITINIKLELQ